MIAQETKVLIRSLLPNLSDLQERVIMATLVGKSYPEIAESTRYDVGYIRDVGSKLWQEISSLLGQKVSKQNLGAVLAKQITAQDQQLKTTPIPSNLPKVHSPLIGRELEVKALQTLFQQPHTRLITITGPIGVGKTRLALDLGTWTAQTQGYGVQFIALAQLLIAQDVVPTIARTLQIDLVDFPAYFAAHPTLLILDNFEHLIQAALPVMECLAQATNIKILITSQSPLKVSGEYEFALAGLRIPDLDQLHEIDFSTGAQQFPAIDLFIRRAQEVRLNFEPDAEQLRQIAQICVRLDGIPLALELAAARIKILSPAVLLQRLDRALLVLTDGPRDAPMRHQTLRSAIDWSYQLLDPAEQNFWVQLAVFQGGFTLEAVHAVIGEQQPLSILDLVSSLSDKSLLHQTEHLEGETRYHMLEIMHEYALEKLYQSPLSEIARLRQRHARYYTHLIERSGWMIHNLNNAVGLDRLDADWQNIQALIGYSLAYQKLPADFETARSLFEEGLRISAHSRDLQGIMLSLENLAELYGQQGWHQPKSFLLGAAQVLRGTPLPCPEGLCATSWEIGQSMTLDQVIHYVLEGLRAQPQKLAL